LDKDLLRLVQAVVSATVVGDGDEWTPWQGRVSKRVWVFWSMLNLFLAS